MFEFDIFETIGPVIEVRDKELERLAECHLKLIKDYNNLRKEYDRVKRDTNKKDYDALFQYEDMKKDLTRWREMYYDLQKERDEFENKLLDTEDKLEETERELKGTKRYLEGYQNLYIEEVLKHKESADKDEDKTLDIYDLEDCDGEDDDNKS